METLSAMVDSDGSLRVSSGPVRARCFGWLDVAQDDRIALDVPARQGRSERGYDFEGRAELDGLRVSRVERFGAWTALVLPAGSRLLVEAPLRMPELRMPPPVTPPYPEAPRQAPSPAGSVARLVLALVLLDLFSR